MLIDYVNGTLEFGGAIVIAMSVRNIIKQKYATGVSPWQFGFFSVWGFWNIFYYPQLGQWWSMVGGVAVVSMNTLWLALYIYYEHKMRKLAHDVAFGKAYPKIVDTLRSNELSEQSLDIQRNRPVCFGCGGRGSIISRCCPDGDLKSKKCTRCGGTGDE